MKLLTVCVLLTLSLNVLAQNNYLSSESSESYDGSDGSDSSDGSERTENSKESLRMLSSPEECARECRIGEKPKTCYYKWTVEYYATMTDACNLNGGCQSNKTVRLVDDCQCILADGFERAGLIVANRMFPGPAIIACLHDNIVVDVENLVTGNAITIHWHGIYQKGYQYADGIPYVTQCPIVEDTTFRYQWKANNAGTHFWHAHSGLHKSEGLMGPIVIREPKQNEFNNHLWNVENIQHTIYIADWFHDGAADHFPGTLVRNPRQLPANFLINGMGQWTGLNVENGPPILSTESPLATFVVKKGNRYRFRLINGNGLACPVTMTIQDHNITIITIDGEPVVPVTVTSLTSASAERFDFIINADKPVGTYWMQFRGIGECVELKRQQLAYLRYESASTQPQLAKPTYEVGLKKGVILNEINVHCDGASNVPNVICLSQLKNARPVPKGILQRKPDLRMYVGFAFVDYSRADVFRPGTYKTFLVAINETIAYVGNITNVFPPSPLLSQRRDIPDEQICSVKKLPASCKPGPDPCPCTHVESIPLNSVVELVLVDENAITNLSHPFHLHGHPFYIVAEGSSKKYNISKFTLSNIKDLDDRGLIKRQLVNPPAKDTYAIPNTGFTIIRFIADNPGYWLFHCHFEFHLAVGMVTTFHVGEPKDLKPPPKGFPKCGNFVSPILKEFL